MSASRPVHVEREETALSAAWRVVERIRQVHALEHATLWVLAEQFPQRTLGGLSTDRGFFVYGDIDAGVLLRAAHRALERINQGEDHLAVHPQCGTNLSVGLLVTAGLGFAASLVLPRRPLPQLLGVGASALAAVELARSLGTLAQRHLTTALPRNLEIIGVQTLTDWSGRHNHFVQTRFVG